jgi:hypothetical protein
MITTKYLWVCLGLSSLLLANTNDRLRENIITTSNEGRLNVEKGEGILLKRQRNEYNYEKELLLNWQYSRYRTTFDTYMASSGNIKLFENPVPKEEDEKEKLVNTINIKGYCIIEEEINIGKQPMSAAFHCNTNIGSIGFFGNYVPYNSLESLFITALHIEKRNRKYQVLSGKILSGDKSSYNVATYVNNRKLAQLGYATLESTAVAVDSGVNDYMEQLEASKKEQTASLGSGGSTNSGSGNIINEPVVVENTEKPDAADYIVKGVVGIVTGIAKNVASIYKQDLPYLYQIVPKSKVYIDLYVDENEMDEDHTIYNKINKETYTTGTLKKQKKNSTQRNKINTRN